MLTATYIIVVAWSTLVLSVAMLLGRPLNGVHRAALGVGCGGVALVLPALLLGALGIPTGLSLRLLGVLVWVAYVGMAAGVAGAAAWLAADTAFVWVHRRSAFPFAFRGGPGSEG
jgi:uncharacterized membrane protein YGL010W